MTEPLVSVILPTYNRAEMMIKAARSVLSQTYTNIELVIVDDHSTDDTETLAKSIDDKRVRYLRNETNMGANHTRNRGILNSHGEFLALVDDDDLWLPEKIKRQIELFQSSPENVGLVYCGFRVQTGNGHVLMDVKPEHRGSVHDILLRKNILGSPTPVIRRTAFLSAGMFDESMNNCQDWDLWIRISKSHNFDYVDEILAMFTVHGSQKSQSIENKIRARLRLIEKNAEELECRKETYAFHLKDLARLSSISGQRDNTNKFLKRSLTINKQIGTLLEFGLATIAPWIYNRLIIKLYSYGEEGTLILR